MPNRKPENRKRKTGKPNRKHRRKSTNPSAASNSPPSSSKVISQDRWRSGCNQGRLDGIVSIARKDGVSVTSKAKWDDARKAVPTRIDKFKIDGVPAASPMFPSSISTAEACALSGRLQSSLASLRTR